jgi:hypothetical protein
MVALTAEKLDTQGDWKQPSVAFTSDFYDGLNIIDHHEVSNPGYEPREHNLIECNIGGARHVVWHTEPAQGSDLEVTVAIKPGLGEIIEGGVGMRFHEALADRLPGARVLTHATFGFGPAAEHLSFSDLAGYGLEQMTSKGIDLISRIPDDAPTVLVGASMGTIINQKLLRHS